MVDSSKHIELALNFRTAMIDLHGGGVGVGVAIAVGTGMTTVGCGEGVAVAVGVGVGDATAVSTWMTRPPGFTRVRVVGAPSTCVRPPTRPDRGQPSAAAQYRSAT